MALKWDIQIQGEVSSGDLKNGEKERHGMSLAGRGEGSGGEGRGEAEGRGGERASGGEARGEWSGKGRGTLEKRELKSVKDIGGKSKSTL